MTITTSNVTKNKVLMSLDLNVGLPEGQDVAPLEYNLGKINKYLKRTGKKFADLTEKELANFAN